MQILSSLLMESDYLLIRTPRLLGGMNAAPALLTWNVAGCLSHGCFIFGERAAPKQGISIRRCDAFSALPRSRDAAISTSGRRIKRREKGGRFPSASPCTSSQAAKGIILSSITACCCSTAIGWIFKKCRENLD